MSSTQRVILFVGALITVCVLLRPAHLWEQTTYLITPETEVPHRAGVEFLAAGHHWIWAPPQGWVNEERPTFTESGRRTIHVLRIDWERTGVYAGVAVGICALAAFTVGAGKSKRGAAK